MEVLRSDVSLGSKPDESMKWFRTDSWIGLDATRSSTEFRGGCN